MNRNWTMPAHIQVFSGKAGERALLVRLIEMHEVDSVMELQERVHDALADKTLLSRIKREKVEESVRLDASIGVFDGKRMAAFAQLVLNRESPERNLGQQLGYAPEDCVNFDIAFVDVDYRGLGIQSYLLRERERISLEAGAKYGFVTVSPDNPTSLRNIESAGFKVISRELLYGGLDRYVMGKVLEA